MLIAFTASKVAGDGNSWNVFTRLLPFPQFLEPATNQPVDGQGLEAVAPQAGIKSFGERPFHDLINFSSVGESQGEGRRWGLFLRAFFLRLCNVLTHFKIYSKYQFNKQLQEIFNMEFQPQKICIPSDALFFTVPPGEGQMSHKVGARGRLEKVIPKTPRQPMDGKLICFIWRFFFCSLSFQFAPRNLLSRGLAKKAPLRGFEFFWREKN